jgi:hypothetical protein
MRINKNGGARGGQPASGAMTPLDFFLNFPLILLKKCILNKNILISSSRIYLFYGF